MTTTKKGKAKPRKQTDQEAWDQACYEVYLQEHDGG